MSTSSIPSAAPGGCVNDCIAICAPGKVVTIRLLNERIRIEPAKSSGKSSCPIKSEEIYDFILRPENEEIGSVLFLTPHQLFDFESPTESFESQLKIVPKNDLENEEWHFPIQPEISNDSILFTLHSRDITRTKSPFENFEATIGEIDLHFPEKKLQSEALATLFGFQRTTFECIFSPPIQPGESRWFRVRMNPKQLYPPVPEFTHSSPRNKDEIKSQILDVLGPQTMVQTFRSLLSSICASDNLPQDFQNKLQPLKLDSPLKKLKKYIFDDGFDSPGTFTRIEDHRIIVVSKYCKISLIKNDGSVSLEAIAPDGSDGAIAHHWYAGFRENWFLDPFTVINNLYEYVKNFSSTKKNAKSKPYITYATGVDHLLGCRIIETLSELKIFCTNDRENYYLGEREFPTHREKRSKMFVDIMRRLSGYQPPVIPTIDYRVLYEASWIDAQ